MKILPNDNDLSFFLEYGLTPTAFNTMTHAARCLVASGDRSEVLRVLFNQVCNACKDAGIDTGEVFREIIDDLNSRLWSA